MYKLDPSSYSKADEKHNPRISLRKD
ncbi:TPA: hypothetical protein ANIA_11635 [Aspergillus nidulans FGSC A4]|uniref:Uncharacterized protein n=1 Tax=Emericella nidulans (strain FGSC A4 / ATCC 38163 / CBS 112.46 / NRRL 194 / M139) TaxID=227321 RepID=C8VLI4_EMENI|nr:TPA: hypothetical protein ANIA_11635 [Aspergillus nidulans FGSC A4]